MQLKLWRRVKGLFSWVQIIRPHEGPTFRNIVNVNGWPLGHTWSAESHDDMMPVRYEDLTEITVDLIVAEAEKQRDIILPRWKIRRATESITPIGASDVE